ncbi:capsular polysaccharide biosynthesis protein, partial [Pseudomonas stutzeri]|nr:capsular polysaccharide biosynthesis protein [Stutzerimonas stutzeri]
MLGEPVHHIPASKLPDRNIRALVGWGMRPSTQRPRRIAAELGVPFISVEDGFLRSFGIGPEYPTLSMVVDEQGIYYAADRPSSLETLLASDTELLSGVGAHHAVAMARFLKEG